MDEENHIDISDISDITVTLSPPSTLSEGDLWIDTTEMNTTVYTSTGEWDTIDISGITVSEPVEFEDCMPDVAKVEDMCNDYPGLRKAYENFKSVYKMVHQDWQGRQEDEPPF